MLLLLMIRLKILIQKSLKKIETEKEKYRPRSKKKEIQTGQTEP